MIPDSDEPLSFNMQNSVGQTGSCMLYLEIKCLKENVKLAFCFIFQLS